MEIEIVPWREEEYASTKLETHDKVTIRQAKAVRFAGGTGGTLEVSHMDRGFEVTYHSIAPGEFSPKKVTQVFEFREGEVIRVTRV